MAAPKQIDLNRNEFAHLCGVTPQAISDWMDAGLPHEKPTRNSVYIDLNKGITWVREHKWQPSLDDKSRKLAAEADMAEMERDLQAGTLLEATEVQRVWSQQCAMMRASLLALPNRVAPAIDPLSSVGERAALITDLVHEALANLSSQDQVEAPNA